MYKRMAPREGLAHVTWGIFSGALCHPWGMVCLLLWCWPLQLSGRCGVWRRHVRHTFPSTSPVVSTCGRDRLNKAFHGCRQRLGGGVSWQARVSPFSLRAPRTLMAWKSPHACDSGVSGSVNKLATQLVPDQRKCGPFLAKATC